MTRASMTINSDLVTHKMISPKDLTLEKSGELRFTKLETKESAVLAGHLEPLRPLVIDLLFTQIMI